MELPGEVRATLDEEFAEADERAEEETRERYPDDPLALVLVRECG